MSLSGTTNTYLPPTLDGLTIIDADAIYINGIPIDTENLVPYLGASKNISLGTFNFETLGSITAKQHVFPSFGSTMMTGPTTSSIFYADAWSMNNTLAISSLGGGLFLSTSYLRFSDGSNNSTLLTLQSDGIADFGKSIPRASTIAMANYDLVNLSTLTQAVAYLEGVTSLNFAPYVGSLNDLNMEASTIKAKNFQFSSPGTAGKVVCTDGYSTLSTTILASQLQYINSLHSNAGGIGETNIWSNTQTFSVAPTLNGLTTTTPSFTLGIDGSGLIVKYTPPSATNLLPLSNIWTGANTFNNTVTVNGTLSATYIGATTAYSATDDRTISPSEILTGTARFYFASYPNNGGTEYADAIGFNTYADGSGGNENLLMLRKNSIGMRVFQGGFGSTSPFSSYKDVQMVESSGDVIMGGKLTVQDVVRFGNYPGGNYDNIQFMRGTGSGQYPNIRCQDNYIAMYVSDPNGWVSGSQVGDMVIKTETGNIRLGIAGTAGLVLDSARNVDISSRELRVSQLNSGQGQVRLKSGNRQQSALFHCNDDWLYFLATDNADWTSSYNGTRPIKYNLTSGLVVIGNGLQVYGTTAITGALTASETSLIGFTTPPLTYPFTGNKDLYVNGSIYSAGTNAMVATFGRNTTATPYNEITFVSNSAGVLSAQIKSHTTGSGFVDATWTYSNTNANPLGSNQGQVLLQADKMTMSLLSGFIVGGLANIHGGSPYAVPLGYMASGSLTIGDVNKNYGAGYGWNSSTAGLLMECLDNTEIMVHDSGSRVTSLMFYTGANNTITMGRDAGWGVADVVASNNLTGACLVVSGGGTYQPGCIYSDANWGMLFRAKVVPAQGIFLWTDSAGTEKMRMGTDGQLILTKSADGPGFVHTSGGITVETWVGGGGGWYGTRTNHPLRFYTNNGSARMTINTDGSATQTAGDNSYMKYGPNATWSSYLVVGASPDRAGASTAQVISTNGNLHLDAGDNLAMYYGYYANSRVKPNPHYFYGNQFEFITVPQNYANYSQVCVFAGDQMRRSQCTMRQVYRNESISWAPGVYMGNSFYKFNAICPVKISGKYSMYSTYVGIQQMGLYIYSQSTGATWTYLFRTYQNISIAQTTYPFEIILTESDFGTFTLGWFDIYIFNHTGCSTDGNNQLHVNVEVLPVGSF